MNWEEFVNETIADDSQLDLDRLFDRALEAGLGDPSVAETMLRTEVVASLKGTSPAAALLVSVNAKAVVLTLEDRDEARRLAAEVGAMIRRLLGPDDAARLIKCVQELLDRSRQVDQARAQIRLQALVEHFQNAHDKMVDEITAERLRHQAEVEKWQQTAL